MRKEKGITLVALVVTIIVLIILAGVSINLVLSQNGIIGKAIQGKQDYEQASTNEEEQLNELYAYIAREDLPENTPETPQDIGKIVKVPEEWSTESVRYIKTTDGLEATELTKVATVYAVSIGNGETIPVPIGFYYVGGNLDTGVIISDNEADKYDGQTDKTTYEYTTSLVGNQFVWIPCEVSAYTKTSWGKQNAECDAITPKAELSQIDKYGGFYVGRYEAGLASDMTEFTTTQDENGYTNQVYNVYKIPQSKAGLAPWNFIDWEHARANAESMYNNNYVNSGLVTGTQWDVIINTLIDKTNLTITDMVDNSGSLGNYNSTSINYTGRKATVYFSSNSWKVTVFGSKETSTTTSYTGYYGDLLTTGASETTEKYHIFDIAGNVWEWTEEDSHYATTGQYRMARGGSCIDFPNSYTACYRSGIGTLKNTTAITTGFRTVLYIK